MQIQRNDKQDIHTLTPNISNKINCIQINYMRLDLVGSMSIRLR